MSRIFYLSLGVLSLLPFASAVIPPVIEYFKPPSAADAFLSIEHFTRDVPNQWLQPWVIVSVASGLVLAAVFSLLMRRAPSPGADLKPIWVVLLFALAPLSLPVFWYCYLRPGTRAASSTSLERTREMAPTGRSE